MAKISKQFIEKSNELKSLKTEKRYSDDNCTNLWFIARPSGIHSWLYRFKLNGKPDSFTIGKYQDVSIIEARELARDYNKMLALGKNPKIEKEKAKYQDNSSFRNIADKAFETKHPKNAYGWSKDSYNRNLSIYNRLILPKLDNSNIQDIEAWQIANILDGNTASNQEKIKNILNMIFSFAVGKGLIKYNIAREIKADSRNTKGFGFIDPVEKQLDFSKLLNDIEQYQGSYNIKKALQLAILIGFRPQNIVSLKWQQISEINEDNKTIHIITVDEEDMKMKRKFKQPLSKQAYNLLMEVKNVNGGYNYVFPSNTKSKHISKDSLSKALRENLGYNGEDKPKQTTHGFRKSVRTYISSQQRKYKWDKDAIRMILSHLKGDSIDNIYDKYEYIPERQEMLQLWADYVDHIKENANVIRIQDIG